MRLAALVFVWTTVPFSLGVPSPTAQLPHWRLAEELRYPPSATAPLARVEQILPGRDGQIYVIDSRSEGILVFDQKGQIAPGVGRRGRGPGEFLRPWRMGLLGGDTLWVVDPEAGRISLVSPDGESVGLYRPLLRLISSSALMNVIPYAVLGDRSVLVVGEPHASPGCYALIRMSLDADMLDTLGHVFAPDRILSVPLPVGGGTLTMRNAFSHSDMLAVSPSGDRVAVLERPEPKEESAAHYRIRFMTPIGKVVSLVEVPYRPLPLREIDLDHWIEGHEAVRRLTEFGVFPSVSAARRVLRERLDAPAFYPPVPNPGAGILESAIVVSREGRVWVQRSERQGEGTRWDVVAEGPGRVAVATAPPGIQLFAVAESLAWGVELDEYDVPTIVRYRIVR